MANKYTDAQEIAVLVHQEELHVGKRIVETGRGVRLHKTVSEEDLRIDEKLLQQELEIERIPRGDWVEDGDIPGNRYEGQTLVVPVLEEVLVVEKKLRLKEEIRITARSHQRSVSQRIVLRTENVDIVKFDDQAEFARKPSSE